MTARLAFVVATKDRPEELRRLWRSLLAQTRRPDEVVVVDASAAPSPPAGPRTEPPVLRFFFGRLAWRAWRSKRANAKLIDGLAPTPAPGGSRKAERVA